MNASSFKIFLDLPCMAGGVPWCNRRYLITPHLDEMLLQT